MIDITHVHPMLVHFPIVLFIVAMVLYFYNQVTHKDITTSKYLVMTAFAALLLATAAAIVAAFFGDIALDAALEKGFAKGPLEEHETIAGITIAIFSILSLTQIIALWKKISLAGTRGWIFLVVMVAGFGVLTSAAWHGGELVYKYGVNVDAVKPVKQTASMSLH
jgi:uncharacterized membrane protein